MGQRSSKSSRKSEANELISPQEAKEKEVQELISKGVSKEQYKLLVNSYAPPMGQPKPGSRRSVEMRESPFHAVGNPNPPGSPACGTPFTVTPIPDGRSPGGNRASMEGRHRRGSFQLARQNSQNMNSGTPGYAAHMAGSHQRDSAGAAMATDHSSPRSATPTRSLGPVSGNRSQNNLSNLGPGSRDANRVANRDTVSAPEPRASGLQGAAGAAGGAARHQPGHSPLGGQALLEGSSLYGSGAVKLVPQQQQQTLVVI